MAVTADHVSGGRVELGIGAGWWEREHEAYGIDLPEPGPRLDALEEQMELIRRYWEEGPFNYEGRHYRAKNLDALPKPMQAPRLPLILGGKGGPRSLRLAVALADEYNTVMSTAAEIAEIRKRLDEACEAAERDPRSLPLSMMTGWLVGADADELRDRASRLAQWKDEGDDGDAFVTGLRPSTIKGTTEEAIEQLRELEQAGLSRIMGQHLLHRDLDAIELLGREIVPALA
jgi:alkanesulfonate monooxygenase SsuD/methylene tetrahydromethanopterin reductase-like flavin-dependent oxidoreductase (luciferase family)